MFPVFTNVAVVATSTLVSLGHFITTPVVAASTITVLGFFTNVPVFHF